MNRMYAQMLQAALARLAGRDPRLLAERAGAVCHADALELESLGRTYRLALPDFRPEPPMEDWHHLVTLHYLDLADGAPVSEEPCSFGELRDGLIRGTGFDRTSAAALCRIFSGQSEQTLAAIPAALGGRAVPGNADLNFRLDFLPRLPAILKIWLPDEDFPATGKLLLTKSADHYLTIEDAVTVGEIILSRLQCLQSLPIRGDNRSGCPRAVTRKWPQCS